MKMNKRAQGMDIFVVSFIGAIVTLLIMAPIMLKLVTTITNQLNVTLANQSINNSASLAVGSLGTTFTNFWDFIILLAFIIVAIIMFWSAFFVDVHPVFFVLFLIMAFISIMFVPTLVQVTDTIWYASGNYSNGTSYAIFNTTDLPFTTAIHDNMAIIIVGMIVVAGIIMYGKMRGSGGKTFD
jgi:uncharacterized membrane protein YqjE